MQATQNQFYFQFVLSLGETGNLVEYSGIRRCIWQPPYLQGVGRKSGSRYATSEGSGNVELSYRN